MKKLIFILFIVHFSLNIENCFSQVWLPLAGCGISDVNEIYHLSNLPAGSLKIVVDRPGFRGESKNVAMTVSVSLDSVNPFLSKLPVGINQIENIIPAEYKPYQNYTNTFNPFANIKYRISRHGGSSTNNKLVTLKVYDIPGKDVMILINKMRSPGTYEVTFDAGTLPSGIYFYKLLPGDFTETKKCC